MAISEELKELYASSGSDVILHTLTFNHNTWPSPFYLVRDFQDLKANLEGGLEVTFQKYAFSIQGPSKDESGSKALQITIDNVSRQIMELLEIANQDINQVPIEVTYRIYLESDTSGPQNDPPLILYLRKVRADNMRITGQAEITNLVNRKFPNILYGPAFRSLLQI